MVSILRVKPTITLKLDIIHNTQTWPRVVSKQSNFENAYLDTSIGN